MSDALYFVHISDSHLGSTREWITPKTGKNPCERLARIVAIIAVLPTPPKFVVHTGDVVNDEEESAYVLAAEVFSRLKMPLYFARGNHDTLAFMRGHLPMGPKEDLLAGQNELCYKFSYGDEHFLVLDSQQSRAEAPHFGGLGDRQLALVKEEAAKREGWLSVFLHHAPADVDSRWYRERVGMFDGDALHAALLPARGRLRGVFTGHLHRSLQVYKDGIAYMGAPSISGPFNLWPEVAETDWDEGAPPGFNFVSLLGDRMVVKTHSLASAATVDL